MRVTFTRTGARRYAVRAEREEFPVVEMNPAPSYDDILPHDFVHFVVEDELGLPLGVFGQLARGGDAGTFHLSPDSHSVRDRSRAQRSSAKRGERLGREGHEDAELSERAATICFHEWLSRSPLADRRKRAEGMLPFVRRVHAECSREELAALSEQRMQRILARLDELSERWSRMAVGDSMTLDWSQQKHASAFTPT